MHLSLDLPTIISLISLLLFFRFAKRRICPVAGKWLGELMTKIEGKTEPKGFHRFEARARELQGQTPK